jgi:ribosomal protein S18 acetylase RimI-like enzyme
MIQFLLKKPSLEEYKKLRDCVDWNLESKGVDEERALDSLEKCPLCACAYDEKEIVGMVRLAGDLGMYGYIQDTIVRPEYQGQGIGKKLLQMIFDVLKDKKGYLLGVCPSKVSVQFYEKFGFKKRPEDPNGFMSIEFN